MKRGSLTVSVVEADKRFYEDVGFKVSEPKGDVAPPKKPTRRTRGKSADAGD